MFEIILTATEYSDGLLVIEKMATFCRRYKSRKTAERKAGEMRKVISIKGSPVKNITTAEVHHVY
ncbi:hypothetical protein ACFH3V_004117 [Escherichia coli]|nr:hypothetical protein [Escherichia coli]